MTHDPLDALLKVRRMAADEARRGLAECLRAESEAIAAIVEFEASIGRETEAATSLAADDAEVEAFAAWLRRIRPQQRAAHAAAEEARGGGDAGAHAAWGSACGHPGGRGDACEARRRGPGGGERKGQAEIDEMAQRSGSIMRK